MFLIFMLRSLSQRLIESSYQVPLTLTFRICRWRPVAPRSFSLWSCSALGMMAGRGHGSGAGAGRRKEVFPASRPQCPSPPPGPVCGARREKPLCFAPVAAVGGAVLSLAWRDGGGSRFASWCWQGRKVQQAMLCISHITVGVLGAA